MRSIVDNIQLYDTACREADRGRDSIGVSPPPLEHCVRIDVVASEEIDQVDRGRNRPERIQAEAPPGGNRLRAG